MHMPDFLKLLLCFFAVSMLAQPSLSWASEWIGYQDDSISTKYYYSDVRGHSQPYQPQQNQPRFNTYKDSEYFEEHDSITLTILTSYKKYRTNAKEKYRYNASITQYVISCSNFKLWDSITTNYNVSTPKQLEPEEEGVGIHYPSLLNLFMTRFPPLVIYRLVSNPDQHLAKLSKRFCKEFYPDGAVVTSRGQKPKAPTKFADVLGQTVKSGNVFTFFWDHATIEIDDRVVVSSLLKDDEGSWYIRKYRDNQRDYAADDAFKIENGQLHHFRWNVQNEKFDMVPLESVKGYYSLKVYRYLFKQWSDISFSTESGITFMFKHVDDQCIAYSNMINRFSECKFIKNGRIQVGPFVHKSGNSVTWVLDYHYDDSTFSAHVLNKSNEDWFGTFKPTYQYEHFQPPFINTITDLFSHFNLVNRDNNPFITFEYVSGQCTAKSKYIEGGEAPCSVKDEQIIVHSFSHVNLQAHSKIEWRFKRNHLGGVQAFVRSPSTSKFPGGWKGFGDFSLAAK